jgi:hypothetical protein
MIHNPVAEVEGDIVDSISNPLHFAWHQRDQTIFSVTICFLTESVIVIMRVVTTSREVWKTLAGSFTSQSTTRA